MMTRASSPPRIILAVGMISGHYHTEWGPRGRGCWRKEGNSARIDKEMAANMHQLDRDMGRMDAGVDGCAVVLQALL